MMPRTVVDESSFRTVSSRDIAVDGTEAKKINIILTGGEKMTPYTQVWKVEFPANTVKTAISQIPNAGPLTTLESEKPKLTDLYSWEEGTIRRRQMEGTLYPYQRGVRWQNLGAGGN